MPPPPPTALNLSRARTVLVLNQFATPGLGSLMAGFYLVGTLQLLFALAGFTLLMVWVVLLLKTAYTIMQSSGEPETPHILGWMGLGNFLFAWGWSWFTSLKVLREAQRAHRAAWEAAAPPADGSVPPRLDPGSRP